MTVEIIFSVTFWKFPGNKFGKLGCKPLFTEEKSIAQRSMWLAYITLLVFRLFLNHFMGCSLTVQCSGLCAVTAKVLVQSQPEKQTRTNRCYQYFVTALRRLRISHITFIFFKSSTLWCMYDSHKKVLPFFSFGPCHEACGILVPQPGIEPGWQWKLSPNHWTTREFPSSAFLNVQFNEFWQMYTFI